jgi:hypothetical protein
LVALEGGVSWRRKMFSQSAVPVSRLLTVAGESAVAVLVSWRWTRASSSDRWPVGVSAYVRVTVPKYTTLARELPRSLGDLSWGTGLIVGVGRGHRCQC